MRKIINERKYDTETATLVGEVDNQPTNKAYRTIDRLYKKNSGEFFRYSKIGLVSPHGTATTVSNETIVPLSEGMAKKWCEDNITVEEYENTFGEVSE